MLVLRGNGVLSFLGKRKNQRKAELWRISFALGCVSVFLRKTALFLYKTESNLFLVVVLGAVETVERRIFS